MSSLIRADSCSFWPEVFVFERYVLSFDKTGLFQTLAEAIHKKATGSLDVAPA